MAYRDATDDLNKAAYRHCESDRGVQIVGKAIAEWWLGFWFTPGAMEKVGMNYNKNKDQVDNLVAVLHDNWHSGQYTAAGTAMGQYFGILMGLPAPLEAEEFSQF